MAVREVVTYQPVPDNAYAVFDHHGRICILATINADLEIVYYTEYDERKKLTVRLPDDAEVTGACARDNAEPVISLRWDHFEFSMFFKENDIGNTWYVSDMKLEYDADQFPEAKPRVGRQMLWMDRQMLHTLHLFGTPVDKAYFCTSKQDLDLYNGDGVRSASVILWDLHLQPYVRNGQFGASVNCPGVPVGRRRINETVPLAVGSTLATVTVLTIAGYAVWRHFKVKKFNYDTME
ncbi:Lysosome-associated membrane glycoprotein 5 [Amphibalanus amphitrite]|uniref:Lysosome-associated membrane glycoprotein 5 n=1 Tax=Amphibalanus amphitrite TaxID=1232801 RepID=A0A6A4VHQ2_AMPAM|nr:Lysosome-associated membrane glycoprotein 5 [Amphibalanus amphitrite]